MPDKTNYCRYFVPAIISAAIAFLYIGLSGLFIECPWKACEAVDGNLISVAEPDKNKKISEAADILKPDSNSSNPNTNAAPKPSATPAPSATPSGSPANANVDLAAVKAQVNKLKEDSDKLAESGLIKGIDKLQKDLEVAANTGVAANTNANTGTGNTTKTTKTPRTAKTQTKPDNADSDEEPLSPEEQARKDLRESLQQRYSSRVTWVLLTSLLCTLFVGIVWFAYYLGRKALDKPVDETKTLKLPFAASPSISIAAIMTIVIATGFCFFGILMNKYLSVTSKLFKETIYTQEGINHAWFGVSNGVVFAAAVFLVAASCAIYYKIVTLNEQTENDRKRIAEIKTILADIDEESPDSIITSPPIVSPPQQSREELEAELTERQINLTEKYKDWRTYSKGLLYIGGAMLTIGLIRLQTLFSWHTAFINSDTKTLVESFFSTSLYNQAVFYTILLFAIYLPIVYILPEQVDSESPGEPSGNRGFFDTLTKFAPQIIALLSPVLAKPLVDFFK